MHENKYDGQFNKAKAAKTYKLFFYKKKKASDIDSKSAAQSSTSWDSYSSIHETKAAKCKINFIS